MTDSTHNSRNSRAPVDASVTALRPPRRWHDPLALIQTRAPSETGRIVLWSVSVLILLLIVWAAIGKLDIIATAEGKLSPQTLVKIVQPAETGVIRQLMVEEGDRVKTGQVLARLDTTLASADKVGIASDLATQKMQVRRFEAELSGGPMKVKAGDDLQRYGEVHSQYLAHHRAFTDSLEQEQAQTRIEHDRKGALEIVNKLEQTLPTYQKAAAAYAKLEKDGFLGGIAAAEKQRDAIEKSKDLDAQRSAVASLDASILAQQKKISQLRSDYHSELEKDLAEARAKIAQLQPNLDKTVYREGLMELRAPQDGVIKDVATTTIGAVVQPGTVVVTLVPKGERLYADVSIKNEDVGFVRVGQPAQIKLAAFPFQKYGMLTGKVIHVSADASESLRPSPSAAAKVSDNSISYDNPSSTVATYKARVELDTQVLKGPQGDELTLAPGMQIVAEINQGQRTVLEYLLSPIQKALTEAGRER